MLPQLFTIIDMNIQIGPLTTTTEHISKYNRRESKIGTQYGTISLKGTICKSWNPVLRYKMADELRGAVLVGLFIYPGYHAYLRQFRKKWQADKVAEGKNQ